MFRSSLLLIFLVLLASRGFAQDAPPSNESRLRDALRNTMLQLNDAQNQVATLQAAQAQSDKDKADLQAKLDALTAQFKALTDQSAADKDASAKSIADLTSQLDVQTKQVALCNTAIAQWKTAYNQMLALAKVTEAARARLAGEKIVLERLVDDRELKNAQLYNLGNEILTRYDQFSLGEAITAKEPFVGTSRVRLQTLVQDYKDKLLDARVTRGQPAPPPPPPVASTPEPAPSAPPATAAPASKPAPLRTAQNANAASGGTTP
jgi:hypothetical protein